MAHSAIIPNDEKRYYAGDSIDIPFEFLNEHDGSTIDISGSTVEFRLKESLTDTDEEAVLTKSSDETDPNGSSQIDLTNPEGGECVVHIRTDDTADAVMEDGTRVESVILDWHIRVTDSEGNRVTSETGDWELWSS